jgi:hypothetical protein
MNTKIILAAAVALSTAMGAAFAQEATSEPAMSQAASNVSRAAVHQEAVRAVAEGSTLSGEASREVTPTRLTSGTTRLQVTAEAREASRLGLLKGGEVTSRTPTQVELQTIRNAGERAAAAGGVMAAR